VPAATLGHPDATAPARAAGAALARPERGALFSEHAPYVMRVVRYLGVAEREVMDVSQEVFVRAFAKLEAWDPSRGSVRTWLYGFCVRLVANHRRLRRHAREELGADVDAGRSDTPAQDESLVRAEARGQLLAALDALPEEQRVVTVLHAIEELPMSEVARVLEIPLQTGYSRYEAARKVLRRRLEEGGDDGGA